MNTIIEVLMKRDKLSYTDAKIVWDDLKEQANRLLENDCSYNDLEELLLSEVGLEADYIEELIDLYGDE
jgi:hypothetical protein